MSESDVKQIALEMLQLSVKALKQAHACAEARGDEAEKTVLKKKLQAVDWLAGLATKAE